MQNPDPIEPADTNPLGKATGALTALRAQLKTAFVERDGEVDALLLALLAGEHALLLGPWGTGKSALVQALSSALDARHFSVLLTKHTVPEEVFGPLDLPALKTGTYRRVTTGRFPEAETAFLDEAFKSSSAILNGFLTALNERQFDNGGIRQPIPLTFCVAASNELPQEDGLGALFDRFLVRRWTRYVSDAVGFRRILTMRGEPRVDARLSADELVALRSARADVDIEPILDKIVEVRDALLGAGIQPSDRRWRKAVKVVQASAVLDGRAVASPEDLLVLGDVLWDSPEDYGKVYGTIASVVSPDLQRALELLDAASEAYREIGGDKEFNFSGEEGTKQLVIVSNTIEKLKGIQQEAGKLKQDGEVVRVLKRINEMRGSINERFQRKMLGR